MNRKRVSMGIAMVVQLVLLWPAPTWAATQRTFVASTGADGDPCSLSQRCRTFTAAVANALDNGEVIALDSAGYGPVTIAKSVSIIAAPGIYAGITVFSGRGVYVHGAGISVLLKGLKMNGQGGEHGIEFDVGAKLVVEDCEVSNMTGSGIFVSAPDSQTTIRNAVVRNNTEGIEAHGFSLPGTIRVTVTGSLVADNVYNGIFADANSGPAVHVSVSNTVITGNPYGLYIISVSDGPVTFFIDGNVVTFASSAAFSFDNVASEVIYTTDNNAVGYVNTFVSGSGTLYPCCRM